MRGTYTRWTRHPAGTLHADLLGFSLAIAADPATGLTTVTVAACTEQVRLDADSARMAGVRLIEAAALADAERAIRCLDLPRAGEPS